MIGFAPCADYKLATYEQIAGYFRKLDAASDRIQVSEIGQTAEGRTELMAIISSEQNMKDLARYKDISGKLATARGRTDQQAQVPATEGKAVVDRLRPPLDRGRAWTDGAARGVQEVTEDTEEMKFIRDNVSFSSFRT